MNSSILNNNHRDIIQSRVQRKLSFRHVFLALSLSQGILLVAQEVDNASRLTAESDALKTAVSVAALGRESWGGSPGDGARHALQLEKFTVEGQVQNNSSLTTAPSTSVYGFATSPQDTPRTINQITAKQLRDDKIETSNDFIYYSPALAFSASQTDPVLPKIRGQAGQVYINGFLAGISGFVNGPSYNGNPIESVDIVAGQASVSYGPSSQTSGYVNFVTKQPFYDRFRARLTTDLGSWVSGGNSFNNFRQQVDVGGPLTKDGKLGFRLSLEKQIADSYYDNVENNYHDVFAALGWAPAQNLKFDYNIEWKKTNQRYSSGWNRNTQAQIDDGTYLAGPATPILKLSKAFNGATYYSPVLNADGSASGQFVVRNKAADQQVYQSGGAFDAAAAAAAGIRAQVLGFVLDPATTSPTHIYGNQTNTGPEGEGHSWDVHQQLKATYTINDNVRLVNETDLDRGEFRRINAAQTTGTTKGTWFENRLHLQWQKEYRLFGLNILHQTDSGLVFRHEKTNNVSTTTPTTNAYGNMLVTAQANPQFGGTQIYPSVPRDQDGGFVTSSFFGNIPILFLPGYSTVPYEDYVTTPGQAWRSRDDQEGIYTQHSLQLGEKWGLLLGARVDRLKVEVENPTTAPALTNIAGASGGSLAGKVSGSYRLPNVSSSLTYKPVSWATTYLTYQWSEAYNGAGPGAFALTGASATSPGRLIASNFHSESELYEAGVKLEIIPDKLFSAISVYRQTRARFDSALQTSFPIQAEGATLSLRYQPARKLSTGLNVSWLRANNVNLDFQTANNQFSGNGIWVDNATLFGTRALTNTRDGNPRADYDLLDTPTWNLSTYFEYRWDSGIGFTARAWWISEAPLDVERRLVIPAEYNVDLGVFYEHRQWRYDLFVRNATSTDILFNSAGILKQAPLSVQGRITYTF
jgi:hypothetical protein